MDDNTVIKSEKCEEWRTEIKNLKDRIWFAFERNISTDVKFALSSGKSDKIIRAHKFVLTMGSPVFAAMFRTEKLPKKICIPELTYEGFYSLIRYIYRDEIYLESFKDAFYTYHAAVMYGLPQLKLQCEKYILDTDISEKNIFEILEDAEYFNIDSMKRKCFDIISQHTLQFIKLPYFTTAKPSVIIIILNMEYLCINSESELLDALVQWANSRPETESVNYMECFLPYIRFLSMSAKDFSDCITRHPLLFSERDSLDILLSIVNSDHNKLPKWCNRSRDKRALTAQRGCKKKMSKRKQVESSFDAEPFKSCPISLIDKDIDSFLSPLTESQAVVCSLEVACSHDTVILNGVKLRWKLDTTYCGPYSLYFKVSVCNKVDERKIYESLATFQINKVENIVNFLLPVTAKKRKTVVISAYLFGVRGFIFFEQKYVTECKEYASPFKVKCISSSDGSFCISELLYSLCESSIQYGNNKKHCS